MRRTVVRPNVFGFDARTRALLERIARAGSVSAAAREVGLDPSNAHRHLRAAEARAGAPLVERARGGRHGGRARLAPAGRRMLGERAPGVLLARAGAFDEDAGTTPLQVGARTLHAAGRVPEGPVEVAWRPEDVALARPSRAGGASSVRNAVAARVVSVEEAAEGTCLVRLEAGALPLEALITRGAWRELRLREGSRVVASVKATALRVRPLA